MACIPNSRPSPLFLKPPNGASWCTLWLELTDRAPVRIPRETLIARPRSRAQTRTEKAVLTVVGNANRLGLVREGNDRRHRAEYLLLGHSHPVVYVGEHRRGEEARAWPGVWGWIPSRHQVRSLLATESDVTGNFVALGC